MGTTPTYAFPYPELTDQANVPVDMKELADRIEAVLSGNIAKDTGWINAGANPDIIVPNPTNFTLGGSVIRVFGIRAQIYVSGTMKVASSAPGTSGDITNLNVGQLVAAYRPLSGSAPQQGLTTGHGGRLVAAVVKPDGNIDLASIGGTVALAIGETVILSGTYLL